MTTPADIERAVSTIRSVYEGNQTPLPEYRAAIDTVLLALVSGFDIVARQPDRCPKVADS